jgi:predicted transposase YbfD/YdcC
MFANPLPYFASLSDPRRPGKNKLHCLNDIFFIVLNAVLSGVEDWAGMETWAKIKIDWLRKFIPLRNGIPAHDTISDVIGRINPKEFNVCFTAWMRDSLPSLVGKHLAIDGKTLRGSARDGEKAVHIVSAFVSCARWVLTQQAIAEKSNEITAIPDILRFINIRGATITIDAMGCQKSIVKQIVDGGADYVLALKGNQRKIYAESKRRLDAADVDGGPAVHETVDTGHGRIEIRRYMIIDQIDDLPQKKAWSGLKAIGMAECARMVKGVRTMERRYFFLSFVDLERFAATVRDHWSIEASQHCVLDVQFHEDQNRARKNHSATNLALIRRMSLNLLRRNVNDRRSIRGRKIHAAHDDAYRAELLGLTDGIDPG